MLLSSLRMTKRDWRAGELHFLLVALIVAVAALSSVGFFVDRMRTQLDRDASQLLAADLLIRGDAPLPLEWFEEAAQRGLQVADTTVFPSMASVERGEQSGTRLASIKAVSTAYPLRGKLKIADGMEETAIPATTIPAAGTVWVDAAILRSLGVSVGDHLKLGDQRFMIAKVIAFEPDRGAGFMSFAPRVMLAKSDLAATGLIRFGSRVTYRLLVAGDKSAVADFGKFVEQRVDEQKLRGIRIESLDSGRSGMQATLERAEQFLSLVSLLSAMLAAVAVAMAARRFMLRHVSACAMLRCLGMTQNQVTLLYLIEFLLVGLIGSVIGMAIGFGAHFLLIQWLGALMPGDLPPASLLPAAHAIIAGLILLLGFAIPPIMQLRNVPHNRVIRQEQSLPQPATIATYGFGLLTFFGLLLWQTGNLRLGLMTAGGFLAGLVLFALISRGALKSLQFLRPAAHHPHWRFALTGLQRRPGATVVQIVALSLGLMALLLLTVIRGDLVAAWRQATPSDAPNRFVINIQPEQKVQVEKYLQQAEVKHARLFPMIRGRLLSINGEAVNGEAYTEDRAKRLVDREFNLSTMHDIPEGNEIRAGKWYDDSAPEASVEAGLAETLHLKLGDMLRFDIAGETVDVRITSLRALEWGSMRVNFFVIINPSTMQNMPQTWITAFHLPPEQVSLDNLLTQELPNLTVVDIGSIVKQIQDVVDQVVAAVEFLFLFTLASGMLVLYAALLASQDERKREAGLLRALGATHAQLSRAQWIEFLLVGSLAGMLAAAGATAIGWSLARFAFDFSWIFSPWVWLIGISLGAACAAAGGWIGLRHVLRQPPLQTLREA